jgi:hypothetical protein
MAAVLYRYIEVLFVTQNCHVAAFQQIVKLVNRSAVERWYTHHQAVVTWCVTDPILAGVCGANVVRYVIGEINSLLFFCCIFKLN